MIINVVGIGPNFQQDSLWEPLFEILIGAAEAGYELRVINWLECENDCLAGGAGNIYLDMAPTVTDIPYVCFEKGIAVEAMVEKIQEFAGWIEDPSTFPRSTPEEKKEEEKCPFFGDLDPYKDLTDLGSDVTLKELDSLQIGSFKIDIQGKEISFSKEDIVTLVKLQNLMEKYGYKITKVIT